VSRIIAAAIVLLFVTLLLPTNAPATATPIPHENYDLIGTNIDALIALLNSSIGYSEFALTAMYFESMSAVSENLTIVQGLLTPAELLLEKIQTIATSYENLSLLLPPFADLSSQMSTFATMEVSLLADRYSILSASQVANLTGEALVQAIDAIKSFNSLITQMNFTIDDMLVSANEIVNLTVDNRTPFSQNQLIPLIERLRDLLRSIELEIEAVIQGQTSWDKTQPFIILWIAENSYYLGDTILGGGYLYYSGAFQAGKTVDILMDGQNLTSTVTSPIGKFAFSYDIPVDSIWLGSHSLVATAQSPNGTLISDPVPIIVRLIPTVVSLTLSGTQFTIDQQVVATISLRDARGRAVQNASLVLAIDSENIPLMTGTDGLLTYVTPTSTLGFGSHTAQALYAGVLPYASSSSASEQFVVNIPTNLSLMLFLNRLSYANFLVGNGTLRANGTEVLSNQEITLSIDDVVVANITTDAHGEFAYSIPASNMILGSHVLKAEFIHKDEVWRYSSDEQGFTVVGPRTGAYPFFPFLGNWGQGLSPDIIIPYLFVGPYAYLFWLLLLTLVGLAVRVMQMRSRHEVAEKLARESVILDLTAAGTMTPAADIKAEELIADLKEAAQASSSNPNERIVLYYQRFLSFLINRGRVSVRSSMTHWEVARLLRSLGYPMKPVEKVTVLFERAFYSGSSLTEEDAISMSTAMTGLISARGPGVTHAS
jgi:hypothetical protein